MSSSGRAETYVLAISDYLPGWRPGQPIDGRRITAALAARGVTVTLCDPDGRSGRVTIDADRDPVAALAGVTIGPTDAELAAQQRQAAFAAAQQAVAAATTVPGFMDAMKQFVRLLAPDDSW